MELSKAWEALGDWAQRLKDDWVGDDPKPELSRLDKLDGLAEA